MQLLRKEADQLRENVLKAEAAIRNAKKTCQEENAKLNEVVARFRAADDVRQEAYAHLQSLRKRLYDKVCSVFAHDFQYVNSSLLH